MCLSCETEAWALLDLSTRERSQAYLHQVYQGLISEEVLEDSGMVDLFVSSQMTMATFPESENCILC